MGLKVVGELELDGIAVTPLAHYGHVAGICLLDLVADLECRLVAPLGDSDEELKGLTAFKEDSESILVADGVVGHRVESNTLTAGGSGGNNTLECLVDNDAAITLKRTDEGEDARTRRADTSTAAVEAAGAELLEAAGCQTATVVVKRAIAVEEHGLVEETLLDGQALLILGVKAAVERVVRGPLHSVDVLDLTREEVESCKHSHPGYGNAGLLHLYLVVLSLLYDGVVKELVCTAGATDDGYVGLVHLLNELADRVEIFLLAGELVVCEQTLEEGHHLICLVYGVLEGRDLVKDSELGEITARASAKTDYVLGKVEVGLLAGSLIEVDEGLENGAGVETEPMAGGLENTLLTLALADLLDDVVGVAAERLEDLAFKRLVTADVDKVHHAGEHVLSAPKIPTVELHFFGISGESTVLALYLEQLSYRVVKHLVELLVAVISVGQTRAAHHLAPVLTSPADIVVVGILGEDLNELVPGLLVEELVALGREDCIVHKSYVLCLGNVEVAKLIFDHIFSFTLSSVLRQFPRR